MGHPIHKHMHTHITKQNVKAAIRDDKAHMDYLKRDIKDDARGKGDGNKEWETADEKHITNLARDVKDDERKEHISRHSSDKQLTMERRAALNEDDPIKDREWDSIHNTKKLG
tara:strand:- start:3443 stop:3781 length:339 start_codon:yes stop_codon:yes gene_type:complete